METKRCAYFGCMHPIFESDDNRRKYCSDDCAHKALIRSKSRKKASVKANVKAAAKLSPEELRLRRAKYKQNAYAKGNYEPPKDWLNK